MLLAEEIRKARRVYLIGNGGSYATANHITNDLVAAGVRAHAMEASTLTAFANDFGYEEAFARWISVMGEKGDLLIALSGSGKSANIARALRAARALGMRSIGIFGNFGSEAQAEADIVLKNGGDMQEAEEVQLELGHDAMRALKG